MSLLGGLTSAIKAKVAEVSEAKLLLEKAEERCANEAKTYEPLKEETKAQQKLLSFLLSHAFDQYNLTQRCSLSDWNHLPQNIKVKAVKKYSFFSWNEYSFYTCDGVYYHCKKKGIHAFLYYNGINAYNAETCDVDYGKAHDKRNIADWSSFEKKIVEQISLIHKAPETANASVLAFCFNNCSDFKDDLQYYSKSAEVRNAFNKYEKQMPDILRENWDHIHIVTMNAEKIEVQFWAYFALPEKVSFSEDDDEEDIAEKEREQQRIQQEYDEKIDHAEITQMLLAEEKDAIAELYQAVLQDLYGVCYRKENIIFLDNADFTYEKRSIF